MSAYSNAISIPTVGDVFVVHKDRFKHRSLLIASPASSVMIVSPTPSPPSSLSVQSYWSDDHHMSRSPSPPFSPISLIYEGTQTSPVPLCDVSTQTDSVVSEALYLDAVSTSSQTEATGLQGYMVE